MGFEDQRSTILAVDNFNSIVLVGHVIRVDHVLSYKSPGASDAERKKLRNSKNYAELVDEELFKSATGDLMMIPPPNEAQSVETADASTASDLRAKRPRTFEEKELLRKYNEGLIDETEYRKSKRALKKALYNKKSAD